MRALITGVGGQDGYYLSKLLLQKGYEVFGIARKDPNLSGITFIQADITNEEQMHAALIKAQPDEIYHLAAISSPKEKADMMPTNAYATQQLLKLTKECTPSAKFAFASSALIFGSTPPKQSEATPLNPIGEYAKSKAYAHKKVIEARADGLFAVNVILFNHESPRRPEKFVTRKITKAVARIKLNLQEDLKLGSITSRRDWSHAKDCMEAMYKTLQQDQPDDYCVGSGKQRTVEQFCKAAFDHVGLNYKEYVRAEPHEPEGDLEADITKITSIGWEPQITFEQLVAEMVDYDLKQEEVQAPSTR